MADHPYLLNIYLALRGFRTNPCHFSLIINGELQMRQNPTDPSVPAGRCTTAARACTGKAEHFPRPLAAARNKLTPSGIRARARPSPRPGILAARRSACPTIRAGLPWALNASFQTRCWVANQLVLCICSGEHPPEAESALRAPGRRRVGRARWAPRPLRSAKRGVSAPGGSYAGVPGFGVQGPFFIYQQR